MRPNYTVITSVAAFSLLALPMSAAVIADFNFTGATQALRGASSDTELNSTATFAPIPNLTDVGTTDSTGGVAFIRASATSNNLADALTDTDVFTVTIAADEDFVFNLTSLTFDYGGSSDTIDLITNAVIHSGGSTVFNEEFNAGRVSAGAGGSFDTGNSADLSGPTFQGITSATFTFANFDNTNSGSSTNRWDNIVINGEVVAVPEPSSIALLGLGGLALILRRRK